MKPIYSLFLAVLAETSAVVLTMVASLVAPTHFWLLLPPTSPPKNYPTMCSAKRSNSLNSCGNMPDSAPARAMKFQVQIEEPPQNYGTSDIWGFAPTRF